MFYKCSLTTPQGPVKNFPALPLCTQNRVRNLSVAPGVLTTRLPAAPPASPQPVHAAQGDQGCGLRGEWILAPPGSVPGQLCTCLLAGKTGATTESWWQRTLPPDEGNASRHARGLFSQLELLEGC